MGKPGPRPTPTEVLRARGSRRANLNKHEPKPPPGRPECPAWLGPEARAVWDDLVPVLEAMGVLTRADGNALARYCRLYVRYKRVEAFIEQYGETYPLKDGNGRIKCFMPFPQVHTAAKLAALLTRLEEEFGLTPSARSRIQIDPSFKRAGRHSEFYEKFLAPRPPTPAPPAGDAD